jgi:hypothetical protein
MHRNAGPAPRILNLGTIEMHSSQLIAQDVPTQVDVYSTHSYNVFTVTGCLGLNQSDIALQLRRK